MIELYVVRHGESARNLASALAFEGDPALLALQIEAGREEEEWPLTRLGQEQSRRAGVWLRSELACTPIVFSSPFVRAMETAAELCLGGEVLIDERLRERHWGAYAPGQYDPARYMADLEVCNLPDWRSGFPGAESIRDLVPSSRSFVEDAADRSNGQPVVAVTHGGRMVAIEILFEGHVPERQLTNCCILHYRLAAAGSAVRAVYPAQPELPDSEWATIQNPIDG